jgi:hypothetical protein
MLDVDKMPQIPFEIYDGSYGKTVKVLAGCKDDANSHVIYFDSDKLLLLSDITASVNKIFDSPGVKRLLICREKPLDNSIVVRYSNIKR